jgi:hypothetical protein
MSARGAAATVFVTGSTYLFCEALAAAAALALVGAVVGMSIVGGAVILGLVAFCASIGEAARTRDTGWIADLLLAPVVASAAVLLLFHPLYHLELNLAGRYNEYVRVVNGNPPPISHAIIAFFCGLAAFFSLIAASALAIWGMWTGDRIPRKAAYLGFVVVAVYWEMVAVALIKHVQF